MVKSIFCGSLFFMLVKSVHLFWLAQSKHIVSLEFSFLLNRSINMEIELFNRKKLQQPLYKYHYRINDSVDCDRMGWRGMGYFLALDTNALMYFGVKVFIYLIPYNKTKI